MDALHNVFRAIRHMRKQPRLPRKLRVQLEFLHTDLAIMLSRDDGKRR
jgi:hypothetical protein